MQANPSNPNRRLVLAGAGLLLPLPVFAAANGGSNPGITALHDLEKSSGARIGVAAIDTASGNALFHREAERFTMCSTFKLSLAGLVLARAAKGADSLDSLVHYDRPVLGVSPATTRNFENGMTVSQLCEAAIIFSDNTAANVLLARVGGPAAVTQFWRGLGDRTTRLDDIEPKLNLADGVRNTTTPAAMMANLKTMLLGDALPFAARAQLQGWMDANTTGGALLRAGLPPAWRVGDKTGMSGDGMVHDIAVITPPGRKPVLAAVYTDRSAPAVVASVGKILATAFA